MSLSHRATLEAESIHILQSRHTEREGCVGDGASLERHKREGYF